MKLILALVIVSTLAACTSSGTPTPLPSVSASGSACEGAMERAALEPSESVTGDFTNVDQAIVVCDTYEEFRAAAVAFPRATDGFDPRSIAQRRCDESDDLAGEPLCAEVNEPVPCNPGFVCQGPLAPGEYSSTSPGAIVTFTLAGEGWSGERDDTPGDVRGDGFALLNDAVGGDHVISVFAYAGVVYALACSPDTTAPAAMDFITFLEGRDGIQAEAPVDTVVGGRPAVRLDLVTDSLCNDADFGKRIWLFPLPFHVDFHFDDAALVRVYAVDVGCGTIAIAIEGYPGFGADYDVLIEKAEELIATMTIRPAC